MFIYESNLLAFTLRLEYISWPVAAGLFIALGAVVVLLGIKSLASLGKIRQWAAIGIRLLVLLLTILILGNIKWVRQNKNVEVMVLRDISGSTTMVRDYPGSPDRKLQGALDDFLKNATSDKEKNPSHLPDDKVGQISFNDEPSVDALPNSTLVLDAEAVRNAGNGTDAASAIELALETMRGDAMHRIVLIWDGNRTLGDTDTAVARAAALHVPIDVMALHYDVQNAVTMDKFIAPTWRREQDAFHLEVQLFNNNPVNVEGNLTVTHNGLLMPLDGEKTTRRITLTPGRNVERIAVPPQSGGVHQFHAIIEGVKNVTATVDGQTIKPAVTLPDNSTADTFTFVYGKRQVLYVDDVPEDGGLYLLHALQTEGVNVERITPDHFPTNAIKLEGYDAVILANVPRGADGLGEEQAKMLAAYVKDMGGGLVMIGGDHTFGAGGWQGSAVEEVMPVNMEIPAQRQLPKGALVLVMHSCEMPDGNYWGEQCAVKAIETLSSRDEVGIISYGFGVGGAQWDFPLQPKGDGSRVANAIKSMKLGDMPSFDDTINLALNGGGGQVGLLASDAMLKHIIVISDGDPQAPAQNLIQQCIDHKISISTVTVYPHNPPGAPPPPAMQQMANQTHGRFYGPINDNPSQLPRIFIKEARVVRRSIIFEDNKGIEVRMVNPADEVIKGIEPAEIPLVYGLDLTSKKNSPMVEMPLVAGKNRDPLLAYWQVGIGKSAIFASDAYNRWAALWVQSPIYSKFWKQIVQGVTRPPMSPDFETEMTVDGTHGHIVVDALNKENGFNNFLTVAGTVASGDNLESKPIRLTQTGPGTYEADFDASQGGNIVASLSYTGASGQSGSLFGGVSVTGSAEMRDLHSNDDAVNRIADQTGGRRLAAFDLDNLPDLYSRENLLPSASPKPIWDILIPVLLALILIDVAARRIAWDWVSTKRMAAAAAGRVRQFTTTTRTVENPQALDTLKRVRDEVSEQRFKGEGIAPPPLEPRPDPSAKFDAAQSGVEGDITQVVGGATDTPIPSAPKKVEPKGVSAPGEHTGSLLEAKRRAQQKIREKEKEQ